MGRGGGVPCCLIDATKERLRGDGVTTEELEIELVRHQESQRTCTFAAFALLGLAALFLALSIWVKSASDIFGGLMVGTIITSLLFVLAGDGHRQGEREVMSRWGRLDQ